MPESSSHLLPTTTSQWHKTRRASASDQRWATAWGDSHSSVYSLPRYTEPWVTMRPETKVVYRSVFHFIQIVPGLQPLPSSFLQQAWSSHLVPHTVQRVHSELLLTVLALFGRMSKKGKILHHRLGLLACHSPGLTSPICLGSMYGGEQSLKK